MKHLPVSQILLYLEEGKFMHTQLLLQLASRAESKSGGVFLFSDDGCPGLCHTATLRGHPKEKIIPRLRE